jgi:riboflavin kinase/FMN adenylyltransferase
MMLPGDGIYATWAIIEGVAHPSATSIGIRPTFGLTERLVEVYVMDFEADLYGQEIGVKFIKKLRNQEAFSSIEALIEQVDRDVADARLVLAHDEGAPVA